MNNIVRKNNQYKRTIQLAIKGEKFCPFRHEKQMDLLFALLKKDISRGKRLDILECGSGQGRLLYYLQKFNSQQNYFGIDYVKENVACAKTLFEHDKNIKILRSNFYRLGKRYKKAFDIVISYKTLSWLPEYKKAVREMLKAAKSKIYITSLFYDGDISFDIKINNLTEQWSNYLNVYSFNEFKRFCLSNGARKVDFYNMKLDINLPKPKNYNNIRTYTVRTKNNQNLEITGVVILNWKLVVIQL